MSVNFYNLGSVHLFRCIFCRKLSKEPKMMSCMHSACNECLSENFKNGGVECNGCNAVNYVKDLSAFADQSYARNILRVIQSMEHGDKFVPCVVCDRQMNENQMAFTCLSCNADFQDGECGDVPDCPSASLNSYIDERPLAQFIMCENCFDQHCQQNQNHYVFACLATSNGERLLDEDARAATCVKHNKRFVAHCMKSKKSLCNSCLKSHNSSGHTHLTIDDLKSLLKGKVDFEERFQTTIKSHAKSAKSRKESLENERESSINNMQRLFVKLREKIDEAEKLLKGRLQGFYNEKITEIDQVLESSGYFEALGGRLFRTSDDLLSLSSDDEIFTFVAPISTLADQISTFSAAFEDDLRSVLRNKPYMAFNKKAFEELLSVSFASIELQDVPFVDSLCCSVTELVTNAATQICITSACESEAFVPENFKVELAVPGKAPIVLPVTGEERDIKSIVAQVDSKLAVKPGLYKLNVTFQGEVVKNCPSHLKIFPEYSEGCNEQNFKCFELPHEVSADLESRRSSRSNQSPRFSQPPEDDFEMLPDDVGGDQDVAMPKTPSSGDKASFLKGTYNEADTSFNASQSQKANYDELYGMVSEMNLDEQIIRVITPAPGPVQIPTSQGGSSGITEETGVINTPKTKRIKPKSRPTAFDPLVEQNGSVAHPIDKRDDSFSCNEDEYRNYYCDRFKFSTVADAGVSVKKVSCLGIKGKNSAKLGSFNYPIGCAVSRADEIVICDHGNDRIQIFDINGRFKSTFGSNILIRPSAVVSAKNGGFAVRADNGIFFFDKDGANLRNRNIKSKISKRCYGLAAHSDDQLMLLNLVKPQGSLVTVNWDGHFVSENVYEPLCNETRPSNTKCRFMDAYNGYLFVSDLGASKIYITDMEGRKIRVFGSFGSKKDDMNEPAGIKCTENFILVSDSKNNRLKVYGGNGETLSILTFPGGDVIKRPSDICFGSNNILVVNSFLTHEVYVYRIEV